MNLKKINFLWKAKKFSAAFEMLEGCLQHHKECPHLWNLRGDLIQLVETQDGPSLIEAENSYKKALQLDPNDLEALENLAHFYDAVFPNPSKAKRYAKAWIAKTKGSIKEMERIISDNS